MGTPFWPVLDIRRDPFGTWSTLYIEEDHTIPAVPDGNGYYIVYLEERPDDGSISSRPVIDGFLEDTALLVPNEGFFFVDYLQGRIVFNAADAGASITVEYYGRGTLVQSLHINDLKDLIDAGGPPLSIKDYHLDVGTGLNQINLSTIPDEGTGPTDFVKVIKSEKDNIHTQNTDAGTTGELFTVGYGLGYGFRISVSGMPSLRTVNGETLYDATLHLVDAGNPHGVTAAQIGADNLITEINTGVSQISYLRVTTDPAVASHLIDVDNPHSVEITDFTADDVVNHINTATGAVVDESVIDFDITRNTDFNAHTNNQSNPHIVTLTQAVAEDPGTDVTPAELETLTTAAEASGLHNHNNIYYTQSELDVDGGGGQVHWNNIINKPVFGDEQWKPPVADPYSLPSSGNTDGDVRISLSNVMVYRWDDGEVDNGAYNPPTVTEPYKWREVGEAAFPSDHEALSGRTLPDQHPISSITNLVTTLDGKSDTSHVHLLLKELFVPEFFGAYDANLLGDVTLSLWNTKTHVDSPETMFFVGSGTDIQIGRGAAFSNGTGYVDFNPYAGAIRFWVQWNLWNDNRTHYFYDNEDIPNNYRVRLYKDSTNKLIFEVISSSTSVTTEIDTVFTDHEDLHFICARWATGGNTVDGTNTVVLHLDGLKDVDATALPEASGAGAISYIGQNSSSSNRALAYLSQFVIEREPLSDATVDLYYNSGSGIDIPVDESSTANFLYDVDTVKSVSWPLASALGTDMGMETVGVANWADIGTPTTKEKATDSYIGTQSLHIITDAADEGAEQAITVTNTKDYLLRYLYKVSSGALYSRLAGTASSASPALTDSDWASFEHVFTADGVSLDVEFQASGGASEFYIDEALLIESLVTNGGFAGTYVSGVAPSWTGVGGIVVAENNTDMHSGTQCQAVDDDQGGTAYVSQTVAGLVVDDYYTFVIYAKTIVGSDSAYATLQGATAESLSTNSTSYVRLTHTFKAATTSVEIRLFTGNAGTTAVFDDAAIIPLVTVANAGTIETPKLIYQRDEGNIDVRLRWDETNDQFLFEDTVNNEQKIRAGDGHFAGDVNIDGKLTVVGGIDPPFLQLDEVNGADDSRLGDYKGIMFYDKNDKQLKWKDYRGKIYTIQLMEEN